jgi:hypothetical protein
MKRMRGGRKRERRAMGKLTTNQARNKKTAAKTFLKKKPVPLAMESNIPESSMA